MTSTSKLCWAMVAALVALAAVVPATCSGVSDTAAGSSVRRSLRQAEGVEGAEMEGPGMEGPKMEGDAPGHADDDGHEMHMEGDAPGPADDDGHYDDGHSHGPESDGIEGDEAIEGAAPVEGDEAIEGDAAVEGVAPVEGDAAVEGVVAEGDAPVAVEDRAIGAAAPVEGAAADGVSGASQIGGAAIGVAVAILSATAALALA